MEKLPPTSYVRLVDIWLINGQLVPFLEVILLTVLELKREGTSAINHHGFKRLTKIAVNFMCYLFVKTRDVSQSGPKEAFVEVGKTKKLMRCLEITEGIILPIILLIFSLIYWTYALIVYFG